MTLLETKKGEEHLKSQGYFVFTVMNVSVEDAAVVLKSCIVSIEFLLLCGPHSLKAEELPALKGQCIVYFLNSTLNLAFLVSFKLRRGSPLWRACVICETQDVKTYGAIIVPASWACMQVCLHTHVFSRTGVLGYHVGNSSRGPVCTLKTKFPTSHRACEPMLWRPLACARMPKSSRCWGPLGKTVEGESWPWSNVQIYLLLLQWCCLSPRCFYFLSSSLGAKFLRAEERGKSSLEKGHDPIG